MRFLAAILRIPRFAGSGRAHSTYLTYLTYLAYLTILPFPARAADNLAEHAARQAQIQASTERVASRLDSILDDFRRNGISGQDVERLEVIRRLLTSLSAEDMQQVLTALEKASQAGGTAALNDTLAAYSGQKAISTKLRAVINEYLRLAEAFEVAQRFREFAQRQSALMWRTVALAKQTDARGTNHFNDTEHGELRLLQIDQEPLKDELAPLLKKLGEVQPAPEAATTRNHAPQASSYAKESNLLPALEAATQGLHAGKLHSAAGDQRTVRNHLREIARLLVLSQGRPAALRQALSDLDVVVDATRQFAVALEKAESRDPKLEPRLAEIADSADLVRADVESLVPAASHDLKRAIQAMTQSRETLNEQLDARKRAAKIKPLQAEAITAMEQARRALQQQLELAEKQGEVLPETLAELENLVKQVRQLVADQTVLKNATAALEAAGASAVNELVAKAPVQGELHERAQSLQQRAASACAPASQSLGEAAAHMYKAQVSLAAAQNSALAQQAAIDALKRAELQLQAELANVQQAKQELDRLAQALRRLVLIIQRQQVLQFATARAAAAVGSTSDLSARQSALASDTGQLRNDTAAVSPSAASHLGSAQTHMQQAERDLASTNANAIVASATNAVARQTEALKELYAARDVLEKQLAAIQDKLNPTNAPASLADAVANIDNAQQQLERALSQLQAPPPGLLQSLLQQQQQIIDGLNHLLPREQPPVPLREAHSAAAQAGQSLTQMSLAPAVASMKRARASMEQALEAGNDIDGKVPALAKQQAQVQQLAEGLLAIQSAVPPNALAEAGHLLAGTGEMIAPLSAGQAAQLPPSAQASLQSAQAALAAGSAQAFAGQGSPAQANASAAAAALADAQSAMALAQAGLGAQKGSSGQQGQVPGQGQASGDGQNATQPNARSSPNARGDGRTGNWTGEGGADGPRRSTQGQTRFTGLPPRERAALLQSQAEKYPQEYGPLIEQYLKNLADQPSR
jgi:hypothetical protein